MKGMVPFFSGTCSDPQLLLPWLRTHTLSCSWLTHLKSMFKGSVGSFCKSSALSYLLFLKEIAFSMKGETFQETFLFCQHSTSSGSYILYPVTDTTARNSCPLHFFPLFFLLVGQDYTELVAVLKSKSKCLDNTFPDLLASTHFFPLCI